MNSEYNPYESPSEVVLHNATDQAVERDLSHSGSGIASFIIGLGSGLLMFAVVVLAGIIQTTNPGGMDEKSGVAILLGLAMFGLMFTSLIAVVLGIVALFQQNRKKLFGIMGLVFSAATIGGTLLLIIIGLAIK